MGRWRDGKVEKWRDGEMENRSVAEIDGVKRSQMERWIRRSASVRIAARGRVLMREENGEPPQQPRKTKLHSVIPS